MPAEQMSSGSASTSTSSSESVGTLLAAIANLIGEGLRILGLTDKRQWTQDEYEQVRALRALLDEARKDFQELAPFINGQEYYQNDRKRESVEELTALRDRLHAQIQNLRDWSRAGGPINPIWIRDTHDFQRELHRAQCRAARRIFSAEKETAARCLGAFLVYRRQRDWINNSVIRNPDEYLQRYRDELVACNTVGSFQRFGEHDIAFVCDYCDGHIVWDDLRDMPSIRTAQESAASPIPPVSPTTRDPHWQATGFTRTAHREKQIVFSPVAIASHTVPQPREWLAGLLCPFCEVESEKPREEYDDEDAYRPENGYEDLAALQEHLEWQHTTAPPQAPVAAPSKQNNNNNCTVM